MAQKFLKVDFLNSSSFGSIADFLNDTLTTAYGSSSRSLFQTGHYSITTPGMDETIVNFHYYTNAIEELLLFTKIIKGDLIVINITVDNAYAYSETTYNSGYSSVNTPEKLTKLMLWYLNHFKISNPNSKIIFLIGHNAYATNTVKFDGFDAKFLNEYKSTYSNLFDVCGKIKASNTTTGSYYDTLGVGLRTGSTVLKTAIQRYINFYPASLYTPTEIENSVVSKIYNDEVFKSAEILTSKIISDVMTSVNINEADKPKVLTSLINLGFLISIATPNFGDLYIKSNVNDENSFISLLIKVYKAFGSSRPRDKKGKYVYTYNVVPYTTFVKAIPKKFMKKISISSRLFLNIFKELRLIREVKNNSLYYRRYTTSEAVCNIMKLV